MRTVRTHSRVACFVGAMALLFQIAPVMAESRDDHNRPVAVTFTKWVVPAPPPPAIQPPFALLAGVAGGDVVGTFVGEVLWGQTSVNKHVRGIEAMYEVIAADLDRSFTALIRGGQNEAGAAQFDGVVLAGWRTGARVHVEYQRYPFADAACADAGDAPVGTLVCFVGTIHVDRAPQD